MSFPFYKQYDTMDCGPTCIRMIAKFYGKVYSLQFLREKSNIGKLGVTLQGISKASESIGFKTLGARVSLSQLRDEIPLPCIAHWDQNHFVVIYKIKNNRIYVANPDSGLITYKKDEFLNHWLVEESGAESQPSGVILILETTDKFHEIENVKASAGGLFELKKYFRTYRKTLLQLIIGLITGSLLQLIFPYLTQSIVDIGINNKDIHFIYIILFAQLILFAGQFSSDFIRNWLLLYMSAKISLSILSDFVIKLMRVPISFFDVKLAGDIIQRMNDHKKVESFLTGSTLNTIFSLFNLLIFGIALLVYNKMIFIIYIISSIIYISYICFFLKNRRSVEGKSMEISSIIQGNTLQLIYGIQDIRLNNAETVKRWEWEELQGSLFKVNIQRLKIEQIQEVGAFFINQIKNILITFYTAKLVIMNQLTLGEMLACQYIIGQLNSPLEQLIHFMLVAQDARLALSRIKEINEIRDEEPDISSTTTKTPVLSEDIVFTNVSFAYPGNNTNILNNLNLTIPSGKITAIVGASGSGKTTIMKLLLKIYDPTSGQIIIGESDLRDVSPNLWRQNIGTVMQDGFIFSESIEKNIALGDSENTIDHDRLSHAIRIANLTDLITTLPNGLNTKIGSEGLGLSQGQKQRILIGRAVYKNPKILLLDEATNSLDSNNESQIVNSFSEFFKDRTVIIVAHRLSTVRNADQIIVLDQGSIAEYGTHTELVNMKNYYHTLVKNQIELASS